MGEVGGVEENEERAAEDKNGGEADSGPPAAKRGRGRSPQKQFETENDSSREVRGETAHYTCAACDFATSSRNLLKKHRTAKHGQLAEAAAKCGMCDYKCRNDRVLQIHSRKMHAVM